MSSVVLRSGKPANELNSFPAQKASINHSHQGHKKLTPHSPTANMDGFVGVKRAEAVTAQ